MFEYLLFVIIIAFAVYRPAISLGLLLQIHVLRVSVSPDIDIMCILKNECQIDNSPLFGVILPIIVFSIIIINILLKNKGRITYKITAFDIFFFINCTLMIAGCLWSPDFIHSLDITCRYILLGISYFYIIRLYFQNHYDYKILLNQFIVSSYIISLILTCVGVYYYIHIGYVTRMTIPGSHPIPFSMMIGQGFLIAFGIFFTGGKLINQTQLWFQISNIGILFFFLFCQLLTNTRGVTIFMSISVALLFLLNMQRIGFSKIIAFIPIIFGIFSVILFQFNIEDLFQRFSVGLTHDESINERLIAWQETLEMLTNNPIFGVGTDGYQYYGH